MLSKSLLNYPRKGMPILRTSFAGRQPLNIAEGAPQGDFLRGAGRTSRPDVAKHYTIGSRFGDECAAVLDVMKAQGTIHLHRYERGMDLLTSIVAMLTTMI